MKYRVFKRDGSTCLRTFYRYGDAEKWAGAQGGLHRIECVTGDAFRNGCFVRETKYVIYC